MKVAILDDYQNVSMILGNFEKLKKDFIYKWRVSIYNSSYGCNGFRDGPDCIMKTNSNGVIRLLMKLIKFPYTLESDYFLS